VTLDVGIIIVAATQDEFALRRDACKEARGL